MVDASFGTLSNRAEFKDFFDGNFLLKTASMSKGLCSNGCLECVASYVVAKNMLFKFWHVSDNTTSHSPFIILFTGSCSAQETSTEIGFWDMSLYLFCSIFSTAWDLFAIKMGQKSVMALILKLYSENMQFLLFCLIR